LVYVAGLRWQVLEDSALPENSLQLRFQVKQPYRFTLAEVDHLETARFVAIAARAPGMISSMNV
jgi:hypothetical protein